MPVNCPRCGTENPDGNLFCGRCGLEFAKVETEPQDPSEELFCYKHKREKTSLRCGRCERPICHRCVVLGPAGPRCRECAPYKVPITARGIAGDAKLTLRGILSSGPWAIYVWILLASLVFGSIRGCMYLLEKPEAPTKGRVTGDE